MNKCKDCKYWNIPLHELPEDNSVKYCDRLVHDINGRYHLQIFEQAQLETLVKIWEEDDKLNKEKAVIQTDWKHRGEAKLITRADFGCNLFERKEDENKN